MTNEQLHIAIGVPIIFNAALIALMATLLFNSMRAGFDAVNTRFDDMCDLWRAELRRVEEVLDAGLKHLEER